MPIVLRDKVKVRTRTAGLASFVLEDAIPGFRGFEAVGDNNQTYYSVSDSVGNFEIGLGTYSQITSTLTRENILTSSNNNQKINFAGGTKTLAVTFPSELANAFVVNISSEITAGGAALRFSDGGGSIDNVNLIGGAGVVVSRTDASNISITTDISQSVELSGPNTVLRLSRIGTADDDIAVIGSTGVVVTRTNANTITLTSDISQSAESTSGGAILRLDKTGTTDDIAVIGSTGVVVTRTNANTITLTSDIAQSAESTSGGAILRLDKTGTADDITFQGVNGVQVSRVDANTIKIDATEASGLAIVMGL